MAELRLAEVGPSKCGLRRGGGGVVVVAVGVVVVAVAAVVVVVVVRGVADLTHRRRESPGRIRGGSPSLIHGR